MFSRIFVRSLLISFFLFLICSIHQSGEKIGWSQSKNIATLNATVLHTLQDLSTVKHYGCIQKTKEKRTLDQKKRVSGSANTESTIGIQINLAAVSEREKERRRQTVGRWEQKHWQFSFKEKLDKNGWSDKPDPVMLWEKMCKL